jgi:hypothetical protein
VALDLVLAVVADEKHAIVHAGSLRHLDRRSLRDWEALLAKEGAERLDRSTLVRMDAILAVKPYGRGAQLAFRNSPLVGELGRSVAQRLDELLPPSQRRRFMNERNERISD